MTLSPELLNAIEAGCAGVSPGPWETDTTRSDGSYGLGEDTYEGFNAYQLIGPPSFPGGRSVAVCDTLNSDASMIEVEVGEESYSAWDEQGRKNMTHIARLDPATVLELVAGYRAGLELVEPLYSAAALLAEQARVAGERVMTDTDEDDLVRRLREFCKPGSTLLEIADIREAADRIEAQASEITRLRTALAEAEKQRDEAIALKYDVAMDALLFRANIAEAKIDALLAKNAELKEYIQELENDYC